MKKIILIGGGGHALSCIDVIESEKKFKIVGIVDGNLKKGKKILNYKVIGGDKDLKKIFIHLLIYLRDQHYLKRI